MHLQVLYLPQSPRPLSIWSFNQQLSNFAHLDLFENAIDQAGMEALHMLHFRDCER